MHTATEVTPSIDTPSLVTGSPRSVTLDEVHGVEGLESLRAEWSALGDRCPWTTPFQRPEWLIPWAHHFGADSSEALTLRAGGALAGLLPLFVIRHRSERVVALLGQGLSDYLDVLIDPSRAPSGAQRIIDALLTREDVWNTLSLESLRMTSPLLRVAFPSGWREDIAPRMPTLVLPLAEAEALRTRRLRTGLRQAHRRVSGAGGFEVTRVQGDAVRPTLEALFLLHQRRWTQRGQPGLFASDAVRAFLHDVARELSASGRLRLSTLRLEGRLAAVDFGFRDGDTVYAYATGFDPELSRFSPGLLLTEQAIQAARDEGAQAFDFLRGQEAHKLLWGAEEQVLCRRELRPAVF